ncbi:hypothetical protein WJX84_008395, partial [Apatococcus fuscideae]
MTTDADAPTSTRPQKLAKHSHERLEVPSRSPLEAKLHFLTREARPAAAGEAARPAIVHLPE